MLLILYFCILIAAASGIDMNSLIPRENCYPTEQKGCENSEYFLEAYPELAYSATNLTLADTWFWLFTRSNKEEPEVLHKCGGKLPPNSTFNPNCPLIVVLHPFIVGFCDVAIYREWKTQILNRKDCNNVLVVDYSWGNRIDYGTAIPNIHIAADQTVIVLRNIMAQTGFPADNIYIIGHSLGAQMAGLIGRRIKVATGTTIRRISGIDPAGPGFDENTPPTQRLDMSAADLVDVWHTNMGCFPNFGVNYDPGHVNFYINGGERQPACYKYGFTSLLKGDMIYAIGTLVIPTNCWHAFAAVYYKVSINPGNCQFVGIKCDSYEDFKNGLCKSCGTNSCTIMGFDLHNIYNKTGRQFPEKYYVSTTSYCPYCDNSGIQLDGFSTTYNSLLQK